MTNLLPFELQMDGPCHLRRLHRPMYCRGSLNVNIKISMCKPKLFYKSTMGPYRFVHYVNENTAGFNN